MSDRQNPPMEDDRSGSAAPTDFVNPTMDDDPSSIAAHGSAAGVDEHGNPFLSVDD